MQFNPHLPIVERTTGKPAEEIDRDEDGTVRQKRPLTHGILAIRALDAKFEDERSMKAEEGMKRFNLATRISRALDLTDGTGLVDLKDGEETMIRDCTAKAFPPGFYGQIHVALDEAREKAKAAIKAAAA